MIYWNDMATFPRADEPIPFDCFFDVELRTCCAWCGRHLGGPRTARIVSHGICCPCAWEMLGSVPEAEASIDELWVDLGGSHG